MNTQKGRDNILQRIWVLTKQNLNNLIEYLRSLDYNLSWEIIIRQKKTKRSGLQNDRYWALLRDVGNHLGYTADDMHLLMGYKFLRDEKIINDVPVTVIKSTTSLLAKDMAEYMMHIEIWAASMGWSKSNET